ncbi:MAG: hypothetical protein NC251_05690 [Lachnoclostridium sp.]|nr:hypothetical protein [Lachnospira sp.]MCM1247904.1 hypothetical protein [Lachnoclostridium sp.]MCM1534558.1 hypothetical protein [Clostridium sp.]
MDIKNEIVEQIGTAEMVLIGLGEEFDDLRSCRQTFDYEKKRELLEDSGDSFWIPAYDDFCRKKQGSGIGEVLSRLAELLEDKNYFVVTTSTNDELRKIPWKEGRFVAPCGGSHKKQCVNRCEEGLAELSEEENRAVADRMRAFGELPLQKQDIGEWRQALGLCPNCKTPLILNNIYTEFYDEKGYLSDWAEYRKWLQGTMNRRLLVLELGVGMQCPTVIRWPFEKLVMYNNKAYIYRIHKSLYQLSEDLQGKGISISENSVDWLQILC